MVGIDFFGCSFFDPDDIFGSTVRCVYLVYNMSFSGDVPELFDNR